MRMTGREVSLALVFAVMTAAPAVAQSASARTCANGKAAIGFIGISGIECNCTIGSPNVNDWAFRTEPRITSLEMTSKAGNILKIGDVITHVNGHLVTTKQGAHALAALDPGQAVILTVRRNGEVLKFALTAEATCPDEVRLGIYAPTRAPAGPPVISGVAPRGATGVGATPRVYATRPGVAVVASSPRSAYTAATRTRGSFGFGLMCSGNCEIRAESNGAMHFSDAPEVYSIERGSSADKAGIRRGDLITHVNGHSITSKTGGRIFGMAKPGESLRFTIKRGGSSRTFNLTANAAALSTVDLAKASEGLDRAQQSLRELQREQQIQMNKIQEEIRASKMAEQNRVNQLQREFYRQEQEHRRKLNELSLELARAESRMRAASDSMRSTCAVTNVAPRAGSRTLRYTGMVADAEIEVRGPSPVTVTENGDEVTITTGQTQVKVKKHR